MAKFTLTSKGQGSVSQCASQCSTSLPLHLQNSIWEGTSFVFVKEMCKICILITHQHEELFFELDLFFFCVEIRPFTKIRVAYTCATLLLFMKK